LDAPVAAPAPPRTPGTTRGRGEGSPTSRRAARRRRWTRRPRSKRRAAGARGGAARAARGAADDLFEALPGLVESLLKAGRPQAALDAAAAFEAAHADAFASLAADAQVGGLDACDVALLRAKALAALPGREAEAEALLDALAAARPDDFRPLLARGLALRSQGRQLAADKALVRARVLAPKEARKMVDALIGDR
jgi:Flp pilus assembly protein TadD